MRELVVQRASEDEIGNIWDVCTELARLMTYPSCFCKGEWLRASAANLCREDRLVVLVVWAWGSVRAVLPLVSKRNMLGGRDLHFLGGDYYPDPVGLISAPEDRFESAAALKRYLMTMSSWDRLFLNSILEDELNDWHLPGKQSSTEPYMTLDRTFDEVLGEFRKKKRYNLRAMVRKCMDAGLELTVSSDVDSRRYLLEGLFTLHGKRAVQRDLKSTFQGLHVEALHRMLVGEAESVRLYGLRLGGQLIAVLYGFEFCNRFFYYQIAHDPCFGDLSPGSVLLFLVIEDCCAKGMTEFNFLQGDESYKGIWTNEARSLYRCAMKRGTLRSHVLHAFEDAKGVGKRVLEWRKRGR